YMVLDTAAIMEKEGRTPHLPTWLAPVQVRVIPVSREFLDYAVEVAEEVSRQGFRVDLDDRDLSLGKKVREAAMSWVPYIVVIGRREVETHTINVKIRRTNEQRSMGVKELIKLLIDEVKAYPQVDAAMPTRLSMRPVF
ncbi:MAG: His/Gly/Thr/Pro-type tRNA ligase C-terminal domain-containing protein, partial [Desulfurococcaceae archaeon]